MKPTTLRAVIAADRLTNTTIKTILCAFLCAVAVWMIRNVPAQDSAPARMPNVEYTRILADDAPRSYVIIGKVAGDMRKWLTIERHNIRDIDKGRGFDPCYTNIVSDYKPIARKAGDRWEITFVSEIAENLP